MGLSADVANATERLLAKTFGSRLFSLRRVLSVLLYTWVLAIIELLAPFHLRLPQVLVIVWPVYAFGWVTEFVALALTMWMLRVVGKDKARSFVTISRNVALAALSFVGCALLALLNSQIALWFFALTRNSWFSPDINNMLNMVGWLLPLAVGVSAAIVPIFSFLTLFVLFELVLLASKAVRPILQQPMQILLERVAESDKGILMLTAVAITSVAELLRIALE